MKTRFFLTLAIGLMLSAAYKPAMATPSKHAEVARNSTPVDVITVELQLKAAMQLEYSPCVLTPTVSLSPVVYQWITLATLPVASEPDTHPVRLLNIRPPPGIRSSC